MGQAKMQMAEMRSQVTMRGVKSIVWWFNKTMRHALHGLHVDLNSLSQVKALIKTNHTVVLMPIYKSFADPFLSIFIHNHFGMDAPFMFGNQEDSIEAN